MNQKFKVLSAVLMVMMGLGVVACNKKQDAPQGAQQQMPPATVEVQVVQLGTLPLIQSFSGRVSAVETSEVRPQVGGIIDEVLFKEGSFVKKGQELYRINRDNYVSTANTSLAAIHTAEASLVSANSGLSAQQANLNAQEANLTAAQAGLVSAQATLAQAQADLARIESLVGIDAVSKQMHDQARTAVRTAQAGVKSAEAGVKSAQAGVRTAQANVESARANVSQAQASINSAKAVHDASRLDMSRTIVRAPISGRIGISAVTAGTLVSASQATALATISRTDTVYVDIQQSASQMLQLRQQIMSGKAGQGSPEVQIILENGEVYPIIGRLALEDAKVDEATGSVTVRAVFPNPNGVLIPGMYVNANLAQAVVANATLLPQTAIMRTPKGTAQVYVVNADKKIEVREIETSGTFNGKWVVTAGLMDGDQVVVMGGAKVKPDQAVEVKIASMGQASEGTPQEQTQAQPQTEQAEPESQSEPQAPAQSPAPTAPQGQNSVMAPPSSPAPSSASNAPAPSAEQSEAEAMADETAGN